MKLSETTPILQSVFHRGEQEMQSRVGRQERMQGIGPRVIRPYMPDQHRDFYAQLPYMVVGSVDDAGNPWASMLMGAPGFVESPSPSSLEIHARPIPGDPLERGLAPDRPLGMLGIEVSTRRRNRVNVRVVSNSSSGFSVEVQQSFGNCPQYIQKRGLERAEPSSEDRAAMPQEFTIFDDSTRSLLRTSDTFFVSSYCQAEAGASNEGVDVSHRGGRPGFVRVRENTLTIPDFSGNSFFNTMGNFLVTPKAGLLFVDFENRDLVMLTGEVEILEEDHPDVRGFEGAERAWTFSLRSGVRLKGAWPFVTSRVEMSPKSLGTGIW